MPSIQLNDQLFNYLQQHAEDSGYSSADEFVAILIQHVFRSDFQEAPNMDRFFTPARLAEIDEAVAQADLGLCLTREQSNAYLAEKRQAWLDQRKN